MNELLITIFYPIYWVWSFVHAVWTYLFIGHADWLMFDRTGEGVTSFGQWLLPGGLFLLIWLGIIFLVSIAMMVLGTIMGGDHNAK